MAAAPRAAGCMMELSALKATLLDEAVRLGVSQLARATGMSRAGIYKALREDANNPGIDTVARIAAALGYELRLEKARA
ncbi:MAG: helix-turn-helix domain-containing protein [Proteobacteria bacterium]|nr:helix-turn-helix domain-containing protein [Pseudomonadota bacterium]